MLYPASTLAGRTNAAYIGSACVLWLALVIGCTSTGTLPAQTASQQIAYAYGLHTALLQTLTDGINAGQFGSADGQAMLSQADSARTILDAAEAANLAGNGALASSDAASATDSLRALQAYLNLKAGH